MSNSNYRGTTITGADMKIYFGFREIFLNNNGTGSKKERANRFVWIDVGTAIQIRYAMQRMGSQQYSMDSMNAKGIAKGIRMSQGDMIFKNFNQDSIKYILEKIKENLVDRLNIATPVSEEKEGYANIYEGKKTDEVLSENDITGFWSNEINHWDQVPLFDIMIISKSEEFDSSNRLSYTKLKDVKVTDIGSAESIDSTEINDIVKFICVGGIESWKETVPGL
ncbi:MAG: hypothetical protein ACRCW9_03150 [Cetobacterium sp.]